MCMFLFTKTDSVIKNYINLYICVIVCTEEIWRLCMGYNDEYMKKRRKEFTEEYSALLHQKMGCLSKSDKIKLHEKYFDLFLF